MIARPPGLTPQQLAALALAAAVDAQLRRNQEPKPKEVQEHRVEVDKPPEAENLKRQIDALQNAVEHGNRGAPASDRILSRVPVLGQLGVATGIIDPRDRRVDVTREIRSGEVDTTEAEEILNRAGSRDEKSGKVVDDLVAMRVSNPGDLTLMATRMQELIAGDARTIDPFKNVQRGDLTRMASSFEGQTSGTGETAAAFSGVKRAALEEDMSVVEHTVVGQHDPLKAGAQMEDTARRAVTLDEALNNIGRVIEEGMRKASEKLNAGNRDEAQQAVSEMTAGVLTLSSSMPGSTAAQTLVEIPRNQGEVLNGVMKSDSVDANAALHTVGEMFKLSRDARNQGNQQADVLDVYQAAAGLKAEKNEAGENLTFREMLGSEELRQEILRRMSEQGGVIEFPVQQGGLRRAA